ncbi:hypothetical protein AB0G02_25750 [Actinosynnema sp. NPDC023658]|uniref:hypothetical protein n=1 Tax=Actinosynnema sp. NPDC023658 TaxID=3155465 RepID=UPI0033C64DE5
MRTNESATVGFAPQEDVATVQVPVRLADDEVVNPPTRRGVCYQRKRIGERRRPVGTPHADFAPVDGDVTVECPLLHLRSTSVKDVTEHIGHRALLRGGAIVVPVAHDGPYDRAATLREPVGVEEFGQRDEPGEVTSRDLHEDRSPGAEGQGTAFDFGQVFAEWLGSAPGLLGVRDPLLAVGVEELEDELIRVVRHMAQHAGDRFAASTVGEPPLVLEREALFSQQVVELVQDIRWQFVPGPPVAETRHAPS